MCKYFIFYFQDVLTTMEAPVMVVSKVLVSLVNFALLEATVGHVSSSIEKKLVL